MVNRKLQETIRGFFIHLQCTYPALTPFLKGMHLTIDGWREGRDLNMWKVPHYKKSMDGYWDESLEQWIPTGGATSTTAPTDVLAAPWLWPDLWSLASLLASPMPPIRYLRPRQIRLALYGCVDASGAGYASTIELPNKQLLFRHGVWGRDADSVSSNYKELCNHVEAIDDGIREGDLAHTELPICTDNSTVEGAYYKGNTDSPLLFDLVLHLRQIDLNGLVRLHVIHIAGSRMVAQGTDALSRGDLTSGIMQGVPMHQFLPFHLSVSNRCPLVLPWIHTWAPVPSLLPLQPEDWYEWGQGFDGGDYGPGGLWYPRPILETWFLWDAAPGSASTILDQLNLSRLKFTHLNHIFICPRLLTQYWHCNLHKICDIILEIPAGC